MKPLKENRARDAWPVGRSAKGRTGTPALRAGAIAGWPTRLAVGIQRRMGVLLVGMFLASAHFAHGAQTLIPAGAVWSYLDNGSNQGTAWRELAYADSTWEAGPAQLGYGDGGEATVVSFGPSSSSKYITTYFRHAFVVTHPEVLTQALTLELVRDDGAIVYLNGQEVFRSNMPGGTVNYTTRAASTVSGSAESAWQEQALGAGHLILGRNVVAVEVHQANPTSSDISFDLRLTTAVGNPGATLTRAPYVQLVTPFSAVLRWRTDVATASVVQLGTASATLDQTTTRPTPVTDHSVTLTGLEPDTKYYYAIGTASGTLVEGPEYHLVTAPIAGSQKPVRIWVLGDSGQGNNGARNVRDAYLNFTGTRRTDVTLMLGDNAYPNGSDSDMQSTIYNIYPTVLRTTPFWPALGNHDTANSASPPATLPHFVNWTLPTAGEAGGVASGTEKYYAFNFANVHFICLDSMSSSRSLTGPMMRWLQNDLAANTLDWVIAYWHHAPYSRGASNSDSTSQSVQMRDTAVRLLEAAGADLVLSGHSHSYERSYLIDGHYGSSSTFNQSMKVDGGNGRENGDGPYYKLGGPAPHQGTVYAVVGSSSDTDGGSLNHPAMVFSLNALGSMVVDIDGGRLDARWIDANGVVRDEFTMIKSFPDHVVITAQPQAQAVELGATAIFSVGAISSTPIAYQWRKDGVSLPDATNASLTIPHVQEADIGAYDAVLTDAAGSTNSEVAWLDLRIVPEAVHGPLTLEVVEGESVTLSLETIGTLPMGYRWRRSGRTLTNMVLLSHQSFYHIAHVQTTDQGLYTIALTNAALYRPGILRTSAVLTVVADSDGDGAPDVWETANGLNATNATDAARDLDGDGMTNLEEYRAATRPQDAASYLRLEQIALNGGVDIVFLAAANKTYTVQCKDKFDDPLWIKLADVAAAPTNRQVIVTDALGTTNRYYRLLTPQQR